MRQQFNKSIFSIAILATLISSMMSCGGDDDPSVISDNHFPIAVGNSWTFTNPTASEELLSIAIIGREKLSNDKSVFVATADDGDSEGYVSRAIDDFLLFHETLDDLQGELIYSPPIKVGTTWQGKQGEAEVVAQETVSTPAGIFQNCFRINVRVEDGYSDYYYAVWLAKNVGPVKLAGIDNWDGEIRSTVVLKEFNVR